MLISIKFKTLHKFSSRPYASTNITERDWLWLIFWHHNSDNSPLHCGLSCACFLVLFHFFHCLMNKASSIKVYINLIQHYKINKRKYVKYCTWWQWTNKSIILCDQYYLAFSRCILTNKRAARPWGKVGVEPHQ